MGITWVESHHGRRPVISEPDASLAVQKHVATRGHTCPRSAPFEGTCGSWRVKTKPSTICPEASYGMGKRCQESVKNGIPQSRLRTFFVFARDDEEWFTELVRQNKTPFPERTHGDGRRPWVTAIQALKDRFDPLDARTKETAKSPNDPLHRVSVLDSFHYNWVLRNPGGAGKSCYQSLKCAHCKHQNGPDTRITCVRCRHILTGVPRVKDAKTGTWRPIRGRPTAYRRIPPNAPAPTITTASGHLGSDYTIHPYAHRILSARECAELQTIPETFAWPQGKRVRITEIREMIGEAIPPFFTYLLGARLRDLLYTGSTVQLMDANSTNVVSVDNPLVPITHGVIPGGLARVADAPRP